MQIGNYTLKALTGACPEAYDVYDEEGHWAGHLRLRHGVFRASAEDGEIVHISHPDGDGIFESHERIYHLENGVDAIAKWNKEK